MSAAATAAGYLYASGRLRGRNAREDEPQTQPREPENRAKPAKRRELKVAIYPPEPRPAAPAERPKTQPKIQYRTRRWKPE
jgi:hypothetical protein